MLRGAPLESDKYHPRSVWLQFSSSSQTPPPKQSFLLLPLPTSQEPEASLQTTVQRLGLCRDDAFSLSEDFGAHGPLTAYQKDTHPFEQDPNSGGLNRPPPAVCPPSVLGWTAFATQWLLLRAALSKLPPPRTGSVYNNLFPVWPVTHPWLLLL